MRDASPALASTEGPTRPLAEYRRKRDFGRTREPAGAPAAQTGQLYVMHKHAARQEHFDLRIEQDGVLRSWALPKGPALQRGEKRLAIQVEDHPLEYGGFEGTIPQGEYGGGTVMLWDVGHWRPNGRNDADQLDFILTGQKLKGAWTLVRTRGRAGRRQDQYWLLIKRSDPSGPRLRPHDRSVASGRSMAEIAAADQEPKPGAPLPPRAQAIPAAREQPLPSTIQPQLATLTHRAPSGRQWLHEIKFDGYRILAYVDDGRVRLVSRNGHDWTARFRHQARQLATLPVAQAILDGEMVAMTADGASDFRRLQEALSQRQTRALVFQVFDLLYLDGYDLSAASLLQRKGALARLLQATGYDCDTTVRYADHVQGQGAEFFEQACSLGLEGIVSKRANAPYRSGRGTLWRKVKCTRHAEFVVGGYSPPAGARSGFGALLLGAYANDRLVYTGRVGTGFSRTQLAGLETQLRRREIPQPPFANPPSPARGIHWVQPQLVVEVEYAERTCAGLLRQPSFRGIREDRDAREISLTEEISPQATTSGETVAGIAITHPERILYPEQGVTKLALAHYYESIQDWVLPYLARRPLVLLRCPEGRHKACFYQKHPGNSLARSVARIAIQEEQRKRNYVYVRSLADLIALVQQGVLEFHPWGCQVEDVEHPDLMVFDLDPGPGVAWAELLRTARELRDRLAQLGLAAFVRTTGGKGLHLVVPLQPEADWAAVKAFARAVSELHARDEPHLLTTHMAKAKRRGRIFIDYLRNARGATAIASYSVRARPGAPVAVPLRWEELGVAIRSDRYRLDNLRRRLGALKTDPWEGFFTSRVALSASLRRAVGLRD